MEKERTEYSGELCRKFFGLAGNPGEGAYPGGARRISRSKAAGMARDDSDIAVTAGDSGTGKTAALRSRAAESRSAVLLRNVISG